MTSPPRLRSLDDYGFHDSGLSSLKKPRRPGPISSLIVSPSSLRAIGSSLPHSARSQRSCWEDIKATDIPGSAAPHVLQAALLSLITHRVASNNQATLYSEVMEAYRKAIGEFSRTKKFGGGLLTPSASTSFMGDTPEEENLYRGAVVDRRLAIAEQDIKTFKDQLADLRKAHSQVQRELAEALRAQQGATVSLRESEAREKELHAEVERLRKSVNEMSIIPKRPATVQVKRLPAVSAQ